jgi:L-aspartate oxidase
MSPPVRDLPSSACSPSAAEATAMLETGTVDTIVIGTGIAGLACALRAPGRVAILTKTAIPESGSSFLAKGGIAAALGPGDTPAAHAEDTLAAGAGLCEAGIVTGLALEAPAAVASLAALGVPFARDAGGGWALGREAAHAAARIVHAGGDATGHHLCRALLAAVRVRPELSLLDRHFAYDLVLFRNAVAGVLAYAEDRGWLLLRAPRVVLATGGIGALFAATTNPPEATGDGLAMAARAGARLADLEFVQFHPTALDTGGAGKALPLLSEALRGAGATLVDESGRRFLIDIDPRAELATRDVVARAVFRHRAVGHDVHLDLRPALVGASAAAFPTAVAACRNAGIDPFLAPVPVRPAAHYHMGGVSTDAVGATSISGLWACGEAAATGAHGANRLASNSLLEAFVFGTRVAAALSGHQPPSGSGQPPTAIPRLPDPGCVRSLRRRLATAADRWLGLERDRAGLEAMLAETGEIQTRLGRLPDAPCAAGAGWLDTVRGFGELRNLRLVARLVAATALAREESRGAHCRTDFPHLDPRWARRQTITLAEIARNAVPATVERAA